MKRYGKYLKCGLCNQESLQDNWVYEDKCAWCPNCGELVSERLVKLSQQIRKPRYPKDNPNSEQDDD